MKVEIRGYAHPKNGMSLDVIPETPHEAQLLKVMWPHASLSTGYPPNHYPRFAGRSYQINAFGPDETQSKPNK